MAQYSLPISDNNISNWAEGAGDSDSNAFDELDEGFGAGRGTGVGPDDATSYWLTTNEADNFLICNSGVVTDPAVSTGHITRFRVAKNTSGGRQLDFTHRLNDPDNIYQQTETNFSEVWTTFSHSLTTGEADTINNYATLNLDGRAVEVGGGTPRVGWMSTQEFECPDAGELLPIRPMDQLQVYEPTRPGPLAFWIDNLLAVPEEVFTVIRPMPQLMPLAAPRAAPMSYWIPNELAVPELELPPIRPMAQLHPRAAPRAAPLQYWIDNRLPPEPAPPIRPMDQLLPQRRRRAAPYTYWLNNWLAVEDLVADLPPGIQMQVRVFRVNRPSPLSYMIQGLIAVQIQPPPAAVGGARGNQADTMVIAVFV